MQKSCKPNVELHDTWEIVVKVSEEQKQSCCSVCKNGVRWTSKRFLPLLYRDARHSSSLARWAANSRCLRVASTVSGQLCVCGTYASLFFHVDHALLTASVWDDSAAAFVPLACLSGPDCWLTRRQSANAWFLHLAVDVTAVHVLLVHWSWSKMAAWSGVLH